MEYKVIWDNPVSGRNSNTYTSLEGALIKIKHLVEDWGYTEVKLEVIED